MNKFFTTYKYYLLGGLFSLLLIGAFTLTLKAQWVISNINVKTDEYEKELFKALGKEKGIFTKLSLPNEEPDRFDLLVLGIRGIGEEFGGLLTDTILLLSLDTKTGKTAMVSIPRDLYITLPYNGSVKINEVYSIGFDKGGERLALALAKTVVSQITGVYVDGTVRLDFKGFEKLIDTLGGIDIYLEKPFVEVEQWRGKGGFTLPKGWNHLNGERALYYVRSRFATSDFDRARRQQELLLALRAKLTRLGILSNPLKIYAILDIIGNHVKTDAPLDVTSALNLVSSINQEEVKRLVITTENYLYHATSPQGTYILLPKRGDFSQIHNAIKNIFTLSPLPSSLPIAQYHEGTLNNHYSLQNTTTTTQAPNELE